MLLLKKEKKKRKKKEEEERIIVKLHVFKEYIDYPNFVCIYRSVNHSTRRSRKET